jgi:hypothetical protein
MRIQIDGSDNSVGSRPLEEVTNPTTDEEEELMSIKEMSALRRIPQIH